MGIPRNDDFNGATQEGVGYYHLSTKNGRRCSTADAYLRPARGRGNLEVATDAQAARIRLTDRRATGVMFRRRGSEAAAEARREVLLCAGAIQCPQLLQLSGIGPAASCAMPACRWCTTCPASARTCRTTCRHA